MLAANPEAVALFAGLITSPWRWSAMRGLVGERVQVRVRVGVEQQRAGERVQYPGAGIGFLALLQSAQFVDAHACQRGHLLAPQTWGPAHPHAGG